MHAGSLEALRVTRPEAVDLERINSAELLRLKRALEEERSVESSGAEPFPYELRPWPFQQEILDRLHAERLVQGATATWSWLPPEPVRR